MKKNILIASIILGLILVIPSYGETETGQLKITVYDYSEEEIKPIKEEIVTKSARMKEALSKGNATLAMAKNMAKYYIKLWGDIKRLRPTLLKLTEMIHNEEKKEIARNAFKKILMENKRIADTSLGYHLWLLCLRSLHKTNSVEKTHQELINHFKNTRYMKGVYFLGAYFDVEDRAYQNLDKKLEKIFKDYVEPALPKGDSDLIKRIKKLMTK